MSDGMSINGGAAGTIAAAAGAGTTTASIANNGGGGGGGGVELREDAPLKSWATAGGPSGAGGVRGLAIAFGVLSAAVTVALLTQIYFGDYQVVPHGAAAADAAECAAAGSSAMRAGGGALDAAIASAFCLAVVAPHKVSLDSSGSLLVWEYRKQSPAEAAEWGAVLEEDILNAESSSASSSRWPRLVCALASAHATHPTIARLHWADLLQPAIALAENGFPTSSDLLSRWRSEREAGREAPLFFASNETQLPLPDEPIKAHALALYLRSLQKQSSADIASECGNITRWSVGVAGDDGGGGWRGWSTPSAAKVLWPALAAMPQHSAAPPPPDELGLDLLDQTIYRVCRALEASTKTGWRSLGIGSGLAVVDSNDVYVSLNMGLSKWFGSGADQSAWRSDSSPAPLDLGGAMVRAANLCGGRWVAGGGDTWAAAQTLAALLTSTDASPLPAVERSRLVWSEALAPESGRALPSPALLSRLTSTPATDERSPSVNVVQQLADELLSHADSRGGGLASRF